MEGEGEGEGKSGCVCGRGEPEEAAKEREGRWRIFFPIEEKSAQEYLHTFCVIRKTFGRTYRVSNRGRFFWTTSCGNVAGR